MTENEPIQAVEVTEERPAKKAKGKDKAKVKAQAGGKAKPARPKTEKSARSTPDYDFVGRVERLRVTSGGGAQGFEFGLRGRHGKRRNFRFDTADVFAMNAMAQLVLAAHASAAKIGVRTSAETDGVLIVRELESGPRLGKKD